MRPGRRLRLAIVVLVVVWPLLLAWAHRARVSGHGGLVAGAVELAAAAVCHQDPARSFATAGVSWPVCGRCAGLYLAAPLGVLLARFRGRRLPARGLVAWAAVPTALTLAVEWTGLLPMTNVVRAAAAAPLAAVIVAVILAELGDPRDTHQVD